MANSNAAEILLYKKLQAIIDEKRSLQDPLIEILRAAQDVFGYLPAEVQEYISESLRIPISQVYGVVSFYNYFSLQPRGKYVINVCTGTACFVKGAPELIRMFEEELGIKLGETTENNLFTLSSVRCVGACSLAPVFTIGEETFGRIDTRKKLKQVLDKFRK